MSEIKLDCGCVFANEESTTPVGILNSTHKLKTPCERHKRNRYLVNYTEALRQVLALAMTVSPTGREQNAFSQMYSDMLLDGMKHRDILLHMLRAIQDGVEKNNWPKYNTV